MRAGLIGAVACVLGFATVASADILKEGGEFQINTYTTGDQSPFGHVVAADVAGNFTVVWQDESDHDGDSWGIFGQRFASDGSPLGGEFQANTYTTWRQGTPSVATTSDGFIVVWTTHDRTNTAYEVRGQRFDSAGTPLDTEFLVSTYTTNFQGNAGAIGLTNGGFAVAWSTDMYPLGPQQVRARVFGPSGAPVADDFQLSEATLNAASGPVLAAASDGAFVVAWNEFEAYAGGDIKIRKLDASGAKVGSELTVNTVHLQAGGPSMAPQGTGFLVAWDGGSALDDSGIRARHVSAEAVPDGAEFQVNQYTPGSQFGASLAADPEGNFMVTWVDYNGHDGSGRGVFARSFSASGATSGNDVQVNTASLYHQAAPSIATRGAGQFVVVWANYLSTPGDGSNTGVFGQLLSAVPEPPPTPAVTLLQPGGGEILRTGTPFPIRWVTFAPQELDHISVAVSTNNGVSFEPIAECQNLAATATACLWQNPGPVVNGKAFVRVTGETPAHVLAESTSSFGFTIKAGVVSIKVTAPNTNVEWTVSTMQSVRWTHNLGAQARFHVRLDRDDDGNYETIIAENVPPTTATAGIVQWNLVGPPSLAVRARVVWTLDEDSGDSSDVPFRIVEPVLSVTAPKAGANFLVDSQQMIKVKHNLGPDQAAYFYLDRDGDDIFEEFIGGSFLLPSAGSFAWNVPGPSTIGDTARIRATWANDESVFADSHFFRITGTESITVTSPNTPVNWGTDSIQPIKWNHNMGLGSTVKLELDRAFPSGNWELLNPAFTHTNAKSGTFNWTVTGPVTSAARIRVTNLDDSAGDLGNTDFTISEDRFVTVDAPGAPATWTIGSKQKITWSHNLPAASKVAIELDRDGDSSYETLLKNNLNAGATGGTFTWTVTGPATGGATAKVRVRWTTDSDVSDSSDVGITIAP